MNIKGCIYKATNLINGKAYVGQTINFELRKKIHKRMEGKCRLFYSAIKKFGFKNFKWEILKECDISDLDKYEKIFIKKYNTKNNGYNLTVGGKSIHGFKGNGKEHWLNRLSKNKKKLWISQHISGVNNPMYGKGHLLSGNKHFLKQMTEGEKEKWLKENLKGDNNYQKKMTKEELKKKCWINKLGPEGLENWKNKLRGNNNPFKRKWLKNPEKYRGKNNPLYGRSGEKSLQSKKYVIIFPNEEEFYVKGLKEFCRSYTKLRLVACCLYECANGNKEIYKGFRCRHFNDSKDKKIKKWTR